jgi:hypothetical protein
MHLATLNKEKKFGARMNPGVKIERRVHPAEKRRKIRALGFIFGSYPVVAHARSQ